MVRFVFEHNFDRNLPSGFYFYFFFNSKNIFGVAFRGEVTSFLGQFDCTQFAEHIKLVTHNQLPFILPAK